MLHKFSQWRGTTVTARDGDVGTIEDVYFDDEQRRVRYLVVDAGGWLSQRRVLISPFAVRMEESTEGNLRVDLTRDQVKSSPPVETQQPVSRLYEKAHADHYRYPYYWAGPLAWGPIAYPVLDKNGVPPVPGTPADASATPDPGAQEALEAARRSHLRSCRELVGYQAEALDGKAGRIDDLLIDDGDWSVAQFVVDTREWLPGGQRQVPAEAMQSIHWSAREVRLDTHRQTVRQGQKAH